MDFFANRGSCAHTCMNMYGNDVLIHILFTMRMKTLVVPGNTTALWLVPGKIFWIHNSDN